MTDQSREEERDGELGAPTLAALENEFERHQNTVLDCEIVVRERSQAVVEAMDELWEARSELDRAVKELEAFRDLLTTVGGTVQ